jgi:hypothetical protein
MKHKKLAWSITPGSTFTVALDDLPLTAVSVEAAIQAMMNAQPLALGTATKSEFGIILHRLEAREGRCFWLNKKTANTVPSLENLPISAVYDKI